MSDRLFGMFSCYISMPLFAMGHGFVEMLDPFIHMGILRGCPGMLECLFSMLHQDIGMPLFSMRHSFLGVFFHRAGKITTPLPPGSRIIADLPISGEFEDKIQPG